MPIKIIHHQKPPPGTPINQEWVKEGGCVSFWPFWRGGGRIAEDIVGGNPGQLTNFSFPATLTSGWGPGKDGVAIVHDGTNDHVLTGNNPFTNAQLANGAAMFARFKGSSAQYGYIADDEGYIALGINLAGHANKLFGTTDGGTNFVYSTADINDGESHDVGLVYDGGSTQYLYVDGLEVDNNTAASAPTPDSQNRPFTIGCHSTIAAFLVGSVEYLYLFGRPWVPAEAMSLHMRPWQGFDYMLPFSVVVGTLYTQSLAGGLTPAGAIANVALFKQQLAGGITPAGAIRKKTSHSLGGGITPAGAIRKKALHTLSGGITPTGDVSNLGLFLQSLAGGITPTGAIANLLNPLLLRLRMLLGVGR